VSPCEHRQGATGCVSTIAHSRVSGADRYVVEHSDVGSIPCSPDSSPVVCFAVFPDGAPGCGTTLRAVDADGRRGKPSESFCVRGDD
jgi:hypothetical protein